MTWITATLIIVVVLAVTVGISKNINTYVGVVPDKEKDYFATISLANFLSNDENSNLLVSENYDSFNKKAEVFMQNLQPEIKFGGWGWNLEISKSGNPIYSYSSSFLGSNLDFSVFRSINFIKDLKLDFWGGCLTCF